MLQLLLLLLLLLFLLLLLPEEAVCETATAGGVPAVTGAAGLPLPPPFSGDFLSPPLPSDSDAIGPPAEADDSIRFSSLIASPAADSSVAGTATGPLLSNSGFPAGAAALGDVRSSVVAAATTVGAARSDVGTLLLIRLELSSGCC